MYIIRLTSFLHDVKATKENVVSFADEFETQKVELEDKRNFLHICIDKMNEFEQGIKTDNAIQ